MYSYRNVSRHAFIHVEGCEPKLTAGRQTQLDYLILGQSSIGSFIAWRKTGKSRSVGRWMFCVDGLWMDGSIVPIACDLFAYICMVCLSITSSTYFLSLLLLLTIFMFIHSFELTIRTSLENGSSQPLATIC